MISSPDYPTEIIDLTNSDSEVKIVSSDSSRRTSKEKIKTTSKSVMEISSSSKDIGEASVCNDDEDIDFEDESILERIIALTEMLPGPIRYGFSLFFDSASEGVASAYSLSRSITWFLASTATVCFLPLILELERVQTEEQEAAQQRTMMLGPRAAGGGSGLAGFSAAVPHLTYIESK
uniref:Mitochondrial import receptor subunit TOM22 homolog n=1 Tax=Schistosoma japonicum TaxID=6182 RepID=C1L903_SCHJA|nr:Mitochondrial import receptor subunit TOM22 homolog [Schistosoma japonicum]